MSISYIALTIAVIPARISTIVFAVSSLLEGFFYLIRNSLPKPFSTTFLSRTRNTYRKDNEKKRPRKQGFYKWLAWRRLRVLALQRDHYECQLRLSRRCTRIATEVHHIKPISDYPELALELSNLTSSCWQCHELTKPRRVGIATKK